MIALPCLPQIVKKKGAYQGVVPSNGDRKLSLARMSAHRASDGLRDARDETRVLEDAYGRVARSRHLFELMMAIEGDLPPEFFELVNKPRIHEVDGTLIDARLGLHEKEAI